MERLKLLAGLPWAISAVVRAIASPVTETPRQMLENTLRSKLTEAEQDLLDDFLMFVQGLKKELDTDFLVLLVGSFARSLHEKNFSLRHPNDIDLRVASSAQPGSKVQEEIVRRLEEGMISLLEEQKIPLERGHCFDGSIDLYFRTQKQPDLRPFDIGVNDFECPDLKEPYFVLLDTRESVTAFSLNSQ